MENWTCNSFYDKDEPTASVTPGNAVNTGVVNQTSIPAVLMNTVTPKFSTEGIAVDESTPILTETPLTNTPVTESSEGVKTVVKKKYPFWIWGATYFAAILIAPSDNPNYIDKSNTNVTS